ARPAWTDHLRTRLVRADVRADRDQHAFLGLAPGPFTLCPRPDLPCGVRDAGAAAADADARPLTVPQPNVQRGKHGDGARRARHVRHLLLQLALPPERPRVRPDQDGGNLLPPDRAVHGWRP